MTVRYDIKQVSRYVLTRTMNTDKGATVADLAEFTRRDDAERVMGTMRAAIHPVEVKPVAKSLSELQKCTGLVGAYKDAKSLSDVRAEDRKRTAEQGAKDYIQIGDSLVISLLGLDALDEINKLELLAARVANTKKYWLMKAANQAGPQ